MMRCKANKIYLKLQTIYPELVNQSFSKPPLKTLIGCILSQRTRDENGNRAAERLFHRVNTLEEILALPENELYDLIRCSGFYKQKATYIKGTCKIIVEKYSGLIPSTRGELMDLPGVGPKTADIVLSYSFGKPAVAVDVHINRLAKRIGYGRPEEDFEEIKKAIEDAHKEHDLCFIDLALLEHGKQVCKARKPLCSKCVIYEECDRVGVIGG